MATVTDERMPALAAALAADLAAAGYRAARLRDAWGPLGDAGIGHGLRGPALRALADDALGVLARVLALGVPQPPEAVDAALPRTGSRGLVALGLAEVVDGVVVPRAMVRPQAFADEAGAGEWLVASDLDEAARGGALPTDHVLGVGGASMTLAGLQPPSPAASVLDLGTGCGIQTLRARRTSGRVVATDVSERALRFAALTFALNGVEGAELRRGNLFDPVEGERFARIVANPPFVITPRGAGVPAFEYRDGGMVGDELVEAIVRGVGGHLEPGGVAVLLGDWEHRAGEPGLERVRGWVDGSATPLDAWVIERDRLDPLAYAELWIRDGGTASGTPEYARLVDAWLADFAGRRVEAVGFGYLVLRRPSHGAPMLARFETVDTPVTPLGAHLERALAGWDRLAVLDDAGLAASVLVVADDVTEARHFSPGAADPAVIELRQGGGFGRTLSVDTALAAVVGACDGDLTLGAIIDAVADLLDADRAALRTDVLPRVRELVFGGFLGFAGSAVGG